MESKMRWAFIAICVAAAFAFAILYKNIRDTSEDTVQNAVEIQQSRRDYLLWECNDVNQRNENTKNRLAEYEFTPETREFIHAFIDESLPVRDCQELVEAFAPIPPDSQPTQEKER